MQQHIRDKSVKYSRIRSLPLRAHRIQGAVELEQKNLGVNKASVRQFRAPLDEPLMQFGDAADRFARNNGGYLAVDGLGCGNLQESLGFVEIGFSVLRRHQPERRRPLESAVFGWDAEGC